MTAIDLDALKERWQRQSQRVDTTLKLDIEGIRALLRARAQSSLQRHAAGLGFASALGAIVAAVLLAFVFVHRDDLLYVAASLPLLLLAIAQCLSDAHEWRSVRAIDLAAPVIETRAIFSDLRARRLRMTGWILRLSILLWWPLLAVLLKGLSGFDLLRQLHWSVAAVNIALGLAVIPMAALIERTVGRRFAHAPGLQHVLDDMAGQGFGTAYARYREQAEFEAAIASGDAETMLRIAGSQAWPAPARTLARALGWRLVAGVLVCVALLLLNGFSMAASASGVRIIVPGIALQLTFVLMMVPALIHRNLLAHWAKALAPALAAERLRRLTLTRERVAVLIVAALPVLSAAALQVLSSLFVHADLWSLLGTGPALVTFAFLFVSVIALAYRWWRQAPTWAHALADFFCFGALNASRKLATALSAREPRCADDTQAGDEDERC